jgi:hypothetical protein
MWVWSRWLPLATELGRVEVGLREWCVAREPAEGCVLISSFSLAATNDSQAEVTRRFWISFSS